MCLVLWTWTIAYCLAEKPGKGLAALLNSKIDPKVYQQATFVEEYEGSVRIDHPVCVRA